jgi:ribose 5-phosphate isomerase RpiB
VEHEAGKVAHDGLHLKVKIAKHFAGVPVTNEVDDIGINVSEEKGHRPASSKGLCSDIRRKKANTGAYGRDGKAERKGDDAGGTDWDFFP